MERRFMADVRLGITRKNMKTLSGLSSFQNRTFILLGLADWNL
jgi:hypothetical protein